MTVPDSDSTDTIGMCTKQLHNKRLYLIIVACMFKVKLYTFPYAYVFCNYKLYITIC